MNDEIKTLRVDVDIDIARDLLLKLGYADDDDGIAKLIEDLLHSECKTLQNSRTPIDDNPLLVRSVYVHDSEEWHLV